MKKLLSAIVPLSAMLLLPGCNTHTERTSLEELNLKGDVVSIVDTVWTATECNGIPQKESLYSITRIELNPDGQMTSQTEWDLTGEVVSRIVQTWESKYVRKERTVFDEEGQKSEVSHYTYSDGRIASMQIEHYKGKRKTTEIATYSYNPDGQVSEISFKHDGRTKKNSFTYLDNLGSYTVVSTDYDGKSFSENIYFNERMQIRSLEAEGQTFSFEFDDKGNELRYYAPWGITSYAYTYDPRGNWTQRIEYQQDAESGQRELGMITTRTLQYKN